MNQGVEILLSRMDSNPEEFVGVKYGSKWQWVMEGVYSRVMDKPSIQLPYLSDEEIQTLWDKLQVLKRDGFTKQVMTTLLKEDDEVNLYGFGHAPVKAEGAPIQYSGGKVNLTRSQIELAQKLGMSPKKYAQALKEMKK